VSRRRLAFWRTVLLFAPAIVLYTVVLGAVSVLSTFVDRSGRFAHRCARLWSRLILWTSRVPVDVTGLEHLTPGTTYVFVANHQSMFDIPVVFAALPYQLRIIAKRSLGSVPFLGWHLKRAGHLLVDRKQGNAEGILKRWRRLVADGLSLIIFPEGARSFDGVVARFRTGSFLLALQAGLPVVPMSISGTLPVMRRGEVTITPGPVTLVVHPPVYPPAGPRTDDMVVAKQFAAQVRGIVAAHVDGGDPAVGTWTSN